MSAIGATGNSSRRLPIGQAAFLTGYSVVHLADGIPPYQVVHRQLIAAAALANWQPGKVIGLRIDPNDHQSVMLG